jgi:hypothetical protein
MTTQPWMAEEPGIGTTLRQASRLLRGGLRRKGRTLLLSLLLSSSLAGWMALSNHTYAPRFVLRVVEMDQDPTMSLRPRRDLKDYVREAVWTSEPLLKIIKTHGLYPSLAQRNVRAALESMREDSEVDVYQNYFVEQRSKADPPRSARLVVRYRSPNRETAQNVTRDLAQLVVSHEHATRLEQAVRATGDAAMALDWMRRGLSDRKVQLALKRGEIARSPAADPKLEVQFVSLLGSVTTLEREIVDAERRETALTLGAAVAEQQVGMRFDVLDDGALASSADRSIVKMVGVGLLALLFGTPLVALGVGTTDVKRGKG